MKMGDGTIAYYCAWKLRSGWNAILNSTSIIHKFVPLWLFSKEEFQKNKVLNVDAVAGSFL